MKKIELPNIRTWATENAAAIIWWCCVVLLVGPPLIAWLMRGIALAASCQPGPTPCVGEAVSLIMRAALSMAWVMTGSSFWLLFFTVIATLANFFQRRPLTGTLTLFLLPLVALTLPLLAVFVSKYDGCAINPDGVGDCILWGTRMGRSFHNAARVQDQLFDIMPTLASLTVMLGILGWFFAHPNKRRPKPNEKMAMEMRQFIHSPDDQQG